MIALSRFASPLYLAAIFATYALSSTIARADTTYAQPPQKEEGVIGRVGGFFHGLFYREPEQAPPPQRRTAHRSDSTRYNLDSSPPVASTKHHVQTDSASTAHETTPQQTTKTMDPKHNLVAATDTNAHAPESHWRSNRTAEKEKPKASPSPSVTKTPRNEPAREADPNPPSNTAQTNKNTFTRPEQTPPSKSEEEAKTTPTTNSTPAPPRSASETTSTKPAATGNKETLTATHGSKPGRVKSPYAPFSELDVTGLSSGALAMDPTTNRVFRVP